MTILVWTLVSLAALYFIVRFSAAWLLRKEKYKTEWQIYTLWPWTKIVSMDGSSQRGGEVCRRRAPDGAWQFRRPTPEETEDFNDAKAW